MKKNKSWKKAGKRALLALVASAAILSCKKIENKEAAASRQANNHTKVSDGGYDVGLTDEEVNNKIGHLVAVIWDNLPDQWDEVKPTNEMDAMDYMEGVLNYTHGNASKDNVGMLTFQQNFTIPVGDDGNYQLEDYRNAFNLMSDYLVGTYNGVEDPNKNMAAIDLTPVADQPHTVSLTAYVRIGEFKPSGYSLKSFNSPSLDIYKYDRVSGACSAYTGVDAACIQLEDLGTWNMNWYKTNGGTVFRLAGYYSKVGSGMLDITNIPLLTGPNVPSCFTSDFLNYQIFANSSWRGYVSMPCINQQQMNFYLDNIRPLFLSLVASLTTKEFISLTVNPKYKSGGSFSNPFGWGNPNNHGYNTTGPLTGGGDIVTKPYQNTAGIGTYYEHYYNFGYGRYINSPPPTYRKL